MYTYVYILCLFNPSQWQAINATLFGDTSRIPSLTVSLSISCYTTARNSGNISSHTEERFSSDNRQSIKRRIATERLSNIYIARCGYTWLDDSN